jgi:hypothetical protein
MGIAKSNSSKARGSKDPHLESGCAAPAEGLTLDSQLARDTSSGCIATTGTSLVATKRTSVKNRRVNIVYIFSVVCF